MTTAEHRGLKTVHTGNAKHSPSSPLSCDLARKWGLAHGYKGDTGGWIYRLKDGQHIAHGWSQFGYAIGWFTIRKWATQQGLIEEGQEI